MGRLFGEGLNCLKCNNRLDGYTFAHGEHSPVDGDISLCAYCANVSKFTSNGYVSITTDELTEMRKEEDFNKMYKDSLRPIKNMRQSLNESHKAGYVKALVSENYEKAAELKGFIDTYNKFWS